MKIITTYVAEDGTAFEDKDACEEYEFNIKNQNIGNYLRLYDDNGNRVPIVDGNFDKIYFICWDNQDALDFLDELWMANYNKSICKEIGETLYDIGKYYYSDEVHSGRWVSLEEMIEDVKRRKNFCDNFATM